MGYFEHLQDAAGMGNHYPWILLGTIVAALGLRGLVPAAAGRLRWTAMLAVLSLPGLMLCALLLQHDKTALDIADDAAYRWIHFFSQLFLSIAIINITGVLVFRVLLVAMRMQPPPILRDTILGIAYLVVAISLLSRHDVNLGGIIATSAVMTAVIGFSLQDTLGNIMGGVALQMERSIGVGDWIRIGDVEGVVHEIRWRQTSVETRNWDTVVIPNSMLMKSQVTILGRREGKPRQHRSTIVFNVDYRTNPAQVIDSVLAALRAQPIPNVATDPPPDCGFAEFKESYAVYAVKYWLTDLARDGGTASEVRTRIVIALQRAGISLSLPSQNVYMTMEGRSRDQRRHEEELNRRVAALKQVAIFQSMTDEERRKLAEELTVAPFRKGEVMTRQGNVAHHLYIVITGEAEVMLETASGVTRQVGVVHAGDVFGEMGLMTGEPRFATVTATTDAVCYKLDRAGFAAAMQRRPELAEEISHVLARRKIELDAARAGLAASASLDKIKATEGDLLRRIRNFFRLE